MRKTLDVPQYRSLSPDFDLACALEMVLEYYDWDVCQHTLAESLGWPEKTIRFKNLVKMGRLHKLITHVYTGEARDHLMKLVCNGIPPIIRVAENHRDFVPSPLVITGFDLGQRVFYFNDPSDLRRTRMSFDGLERVWDVHSPAFGHSYNYAIAMRECTYKELEQEMRSSEKKPGKKAASYLSLVHCQRTIKGKSSL